jgi:AraC-like DNA-binding protein
MVKMEALLTPRMVFRSMAGPGGWSRIGAGVMDKRAVTVDHRAFDPPTWSLIYVLRGGGAYATADGRTWRIGPGWCFQRVPGIIHTTSIDPSSGWLETFIDLGPDLHRALNGMQVIPSDPLAWDWGLTAARRDRFTTLAEDLAQASERRLPALCVRILGLAVEALQAAARGTDGEDEIDRACRLLADPTQGRIGLRAWCRRQGLDYDRFRKAFQRRVGMPPHQYRLRRRMDRACELLQTTDRSIAAIAAELDYPTAYEFSAQFRARLGLPPSRYRAR